MNKKMRKIVVSVLVMTEMLWNYHIVKAGSLEPGWPQPTNTGAYGSPVVYDIDNDGDLEVIAADYGGYLRVWHHDGSMADGWPIFVGVRPKTPAVADIDGDGYAEIAISSYNGKYHDESQTTVDFLFLFKYDGTPYPGSWPKTITFGGTASPILADMNNDGELEIVGGGGTGNYYVWKKDGSLLSGWPVTTGHQFASTPAVGDIDGDGQNEVVVVEDSHCSITCNGRVYAWNANGSMVAGSWPVDVQGSVTTLTPVIGNIEGGGNLEVAVFSDSGIYVFRGDGSVLSGWPKVDMDPDRGRPFRSYGDISLGDVDSDGDKEVIVIATHTDPDQELRAYKSDGSMLNGWPYSFSTFFGNASVDMKQARVIDIDSDGTNELVFAIRDTYYSKGYLFIMKNDGGLYPGYPKELNVESYTNPAIADIDGDLITEVALFGHFGDWSDIPFYVYELGGAILPTASIPSGIYQPNQSVSLLSETNGATIYYTLDGSIPTLSSAQYVNPINISVTTTLKAIATKSGMPNSDVATFTYVIDTVSPTISGVTNGTTYQGSVTPTFTEGMATLNGVAYVSGTKISAAGAYTLVVTDAASNVTTINFTIENTALSLVSAAVPAKTKNSATISVSTSIPSTVKIYYGTDKKKVKKATFKTHKEDATESTTHNVTLTKLGKNKTYYYKIVYYNSDGSVQSVSSVRSFKTKKK